MPPVAGAGGLATGTKYTFVETVEELALFNRLQVLLRLKVSGHLLALEEGLDRFVLGVEMRHVHDQVFQHKHEHKWRNNRFVIVFGHGAEAGQVVTTVNVHGAAAADAFSTGAAEGERRIDLVLDLDLDLDLVLSPTLTDRNCHSHPHSYPCPVPSPH